MSEGGKEKEALCKAGPMWSCHCVIQWSAHHIVHRFLLIGTACMNQFPNSGDL